MQENDNFEDKLKSNPIWESNNSVLEIMCLGTNMYRIVFYLIEKGALHFTEVGIYKELEKIERLIDLLKAKPSTKNLVLRSMGDG